MMRIVFLLLFSCIIVHLQAQKDTTDFDISAFVYLDSFVVEAERGGFDVAEFIDMVRSDSTFYQAFRNLRFYNYSSTANMNFNDRKGKSIASMNHQVEQTMESFLCRNTTILNEKTSGKWLKKSKLRFTTAQMYYRLFAQSGSHCERQRTAIPRKPKGKMEEYTESLKTLIFQPGDRISIPLIGKKTPIFDKRMAKYYDYSITTDTFHNQSVYKFSVKTKKEYQATGKTVIRYMDTFFDRENFQIMGRNYRLYQNGLAIDVDVTMNIVLNKYGDDYLPTYIHYNGNWNVPTKRRERGSFTIWFSDIQVAQ